MSLFPDFGVGRAELFSVAFSVRVVSLPPYPEAAVSAVRDFSVFFRSGRFAAAVPRGRRIRRAGLFRVFSFGSFRCRRTPRLPYPLRGIFPSLFPFGSFLSRRIPRPPYPLRGSCQSLFVRMIFRPLHFVSVAFAARRNAGCDCPETSEGARTVGGRVPDDFPEGGSRAVPDRRWRPVVVGGRCGRNDVPGRMKCPPPRTAFGKFSAVFLRKSWWNE